jgi:hypothetical protein
MLYLIVVVAVVLLSVRFYNRTLGTHTDSPALTDNVSACAEVPVPVVLKHEITESGTGVPLYIGYNGATISSPDRSLIVEWTYQDEARFGDSWNQVSVNGACLNGLWWGRGHCWSSCLRYLTFEQYMGSHSRLIVYCVERAVYFEVAQFSAAISFNYPVLLYGEYSNGEKAINQYVFVGNETWRSL